VKLRLLKSKRGRVLHLVTTLVDVAAVKELARRRRPGRPRKSAP
jgi:hypothetical protein